MSRQVSLFAIVTLVPVALLVLGATLGGGWVWAALIYLTVFAFTIDELAAYLPTEAQSEAIYTGVNMLPATLALLHFPLLALAIWAVSGGLMLTVVERTAAFFAFGLFFGQVSNSNAHELIHRPDPFLFQLGKWVFVSHLFGHHVSAHRLVHHRYVATLADPNSAPAGMGFYRFAPRAWLGSFRRGFYAEARMRTGASPWRHPYASYVAGAVLMLAISMIIGGTAGLACYVALAGYATMQILLSDYVQHYGLVRQIGADGSVEPVNSHHSWNAPHRFSNLLTLYAPRHSDHHENPIRAFPALRLNDGSPTLPHSLAVMGAIAMVPSRWRKIMDAGLSEFDKNHRQHRKRDWPIH